MTVFHFPKGRHVRGQRPKQYKNYQPYKRYLQREFSRVCVYCRQPDSWSPNLNFGVDHYRPKGLARFAHLVAEYSNLFYCCGGCNSRKNDYWPRDEAKGPHVVNPCDFDMAQHLRFDGRTGLVSPKDEHGTHTVELLQLNDPATVEYRRRTAQTLELCQQHIRTLEKELATLQRQRNKGLLDDVSYESQAALISSELEDTLALVAAHTGATPLGPLRQQPV